MGQNEKSKKFEEKDGAMNQEEIAGTSKPAKDDKVIKIKASEHESLKRSVEEYKDKYIRLLAEFDNTRKRFEREKGEFLRYANAALIGEFLNILDDLQRSVNAANAKHQDYESFLKGVQMVMAHIYEMLKKNGISPIEALGKAFDPHCHEILMQVEASDEEDGKVLEEFQQGYYYNDRVIRTSKVKVGVKKEDKPLNDADESAEDIKDS